MSMNDTQPGYMRDQLSKGEASQASVASGLSPFGRMHDAAIAERTAVLEADALRKAAQILTDRTDEADGKVTEAKRESSRAYTQWMRSL